MRVYVRVFERERCGRWQFFYRVLFLSLGCMSNVQCHSSDSTGRAAASSKWLRLPPITMVTDHGNHGAKLALTNAALIQEVVMDNGRDWVGLRTGRYWTALTLLITHNPPWLSIDLLPRLAAGLKLQRRPGNQTTPAMAAPRRKASWTC